MWHSSVTFLDRAFSVKVLLALVAPDATFEVADLPASDAEVRKTDLIFCFAIQHSPAILGFSNIERHFVNTSGIFTERLQNLCNIVDTSRVERHKN